MKLLSGLAPLRLIDVQPDDIEKALKGIKGDPKRGATMARTRQIAYMFLHGVFRKAVKKRVITFNPCDGVDAPKWHREEEPTIFTRDEQHFLKQAARGTPYEALLLLGLSVPMRVGELLGIARENVNLSRREIAIRQNLGETAEGGYVPTLGPLKTFESRRDVPMSDEVLSAFTRLLGGPAGGRTDDARDAGLPLAGGSPGAVLPPLPALVPALASSRRCGGREGGAGGRRSALPLPGRGVALRSAAHRLHEHGRGRRRAGNLPRARRSRERVDQLEALQQAVSQEPSRRRQRPSRAGRRSQLGPPPGPRSRALRSPGGSSFWYGCYTGCYIRLPGGGPRQTKNPHIT